MAEIYKQIKDFTLKNSIDGTEDILIQSNGTTMRVKSSQLKTSIDLSNYYTKSEVDNLLANIDVNIDMADYYDKATIDNLLLNKANVSHTHTSADITDLSIPTVDVNKAYVDSQLANKSNTNHTHDEYISETELNEKGYATETYVQTKIAEVATGGTVDLSNYATKTELTTELNKKANLPHTHNAEDINGLNIPTKLSELQNDSGFISEVPSEYINEIELNNALANKANTSDIPSLAGYATKDDLNIKADKSEIPSLEGYATETFVTNKIAEASLSGGEVDLSGLATKDELATKADKTSIPTKTSQLTNDSGFLTAHQDISGKADKTYVDNQLATKSDTDHTHSYNDLTDKPTIPSTTNLATKTELTNGLATKADKVHTHDQYLTEHQDLSDYALKNEIPTVPTKTSQLTNDSGFLTSHQDISGKTDKTYVDTELAKKANVSHTHDQYLTEHQDLSDYALKTEIPSVPTKVSQLTNDKGYLTSVPSEYVTETELNNAISGLGGGTGNVSSDVIRSIMVVDALPEVELEGVLYLVKETTTEPEPTVTNLYPSQENSTTSSGFIITFEGQNMVIKESNDSSSVWGATNEFNMTLEANKTYYLQFTNVSGSFDNSNRISEVDNIITSVTLLGYDSPDSLINLIDNVERDASGIYDKYIFTPKTTYTKYKLKVQAKRLISFSNWTCSIVIAEEGV